MRKNVSKDLPVTLDEVKSFLGIHNNKEDALLLSFISICTEYAQWYIEKSLSKQIWVISYNIDNIPKKINLPFGPLIAVQLVKCSNADSESFTVAEARYYVDILQSSITFMEVLDVTKIEITYESGYTSSDTPAQIKYGILHHIAVCYKNRDQTGIQCLAFLKEIYLPFKDVKLIL